MRLARASLVAAWAAAAVFAQDAEVAHPGADGAAAVRVQAYSSGGCTEGCGLGWVRFEVQAVDARAHEVALQVSSPLFRSGAVESRRNLSLAVGGTATCYVPLPVPPSTGLIRVTVDGAEYVESVNYRRGRGPVGLLITDVAGVGPSAASVLAAMPVEAPGRPPQLVAVDSDGVPADWRLYTTFSVVLVDGRAALGADVQTALRRYAFAGGRVVVATPRALPRGALWQATAELFGVRALGLGQVAAVGALDGAPARLESALAGMRPLDRGLWPSPPAMFAEQEIAALGEPPVTVFLAIILLFAVLAGPVNFRWLRRRKRPMLALLTVPALGVTTTVVILSYGVWHDGLGVRGVQRSWTLLDQVDGEGATVVARTLFAGLSSTDLQLGDGALLLSERAGRDGPEVADSWRLDADAGTLEGGVLPSRTITPLLGAQQGPIRARVALRRSGDLLEASSDDGVRLIGRSVVCDLDGAYWSGIDGLFSRVDAAEGARLFAALWRDAHAFRIGQSAEASSRPSLAVLPVWGAPGTYAGRVDAAPWVNQHGLRVDYDAQQHWVFGRLAPEDFVK
ncbi:MAG: hypothetical protein VXY92_08995 [Planctomycetota bacterium]|nr:hypothetical protein [Planctomycetota bacterium]